MSFLVLYFDNYIFVFFYLCFSIFICFILFIVSVLMRYINGVKPDTELFSIYECGFLPFDRARLQFEVKFFVVAILFVLFDLEVIFILPWGLSLNCFSFFPFLYMVFFISILFLSFIYELSQNALEF